MANAGSSDSVSASLRSADLFASFCAADVPSSLECGGSGPSVRRERRAKNSRPASFDDGACSSALILSS
jgi:hypothetical protein